MCYISLEGNLSTLAYMGWLFLTCYTWWHLLTLKVFLIVEIKKTWHVGGSFGCQQLRLYYMADLEISIRLCRVSKYRQLYKAYFEEFVGWELRDFWLLSQGQILQWELQSYGFTVKLSTVIMAMRILSFSGNLTDFY